MRFNLNDLHPTVNLRDFDHEMKRERSDRIAMIRKAEIRNKLPRKAKFGEPCTRCGQCCSKALCPAAIFLGKTRTPCEFLEIENVLVQDVMGGVSRELYRTVCKLIKVEYESNLEKILSYALGIGKGCTNEEDSRPLPFQTKLKSQSWR